jgi:hypothetical protein
MQFSVNTDNERFVKFRSSAAINGGIPMTVTSLLFSTSYGAKTRITLFTGGIRGFVKTFTERRMVDVFIYRREARPKILCGISKLFTYMKMYGRY